MRIFLTFVFLTFSIPAFADNSCTKSFVCTVQGCNEVRLCSESSQAIVQSPNSVGSYASVGKTASSPTIAQSAPVSSPIASLPACSESGSCYGDISAITGLPKTNYVNGYVRKDGTAVRGYYRSRR